MHLVGWDKVPLRKRDGGLGIRTTREANNAILAKAGRKETASRGYNTSLLFTSAGDQLPFLSPSCYMSLIVLQDRNEVARQHSGETRCKGTLKSPNAYPDPAALDPP
ncbi:unnamed protein product [Vicia faba]|uniref:Uncharacterized protein n=1 Tax=Vicia faba TaxID=3906 RepID=A0AAV1ADW2_VICFA|nr:unnamed protein product [Vicia faba]